MLSPFFEVQNIGVFDYSLGRQPEESNPVHIINAYDFEFYTETGPGGLELDGTFYQALRNGCILAKPGQEEIVRKPYRGYYLNIATQDPELCDMLDHLPTCFTLWNMDEVIKLIHKMIATEDKSSLVSRMQIQSMACQILAILCPYRNRPQNSDSKVLQHRKTLQMIDKYIRQHLSADLSLTVLSKQCNMDPTYFHKLYTTAFGKTPAQRILGFRIAAAKTGLIESKIPIGELALKCGFSSQTYFCYKFKQLTGMTPAQYRRTMLSNPEK